MPSRLILKLLDYDRDSIQVSFPGVTTSDATYNADLGEAEALADAIEGITLGTRVYRDFVGERDEVSPAVPPASPLAQTNIQWECTFTDNVNGREFHIRIGTADLTLATTVVNGRPTVPLDAGAGLAFKTAFEAFVRSEDGNAVTLQSVQYYE